MSDGTGLGLLIVPALLMVVIGALAVAALWRIRQRRNQGDAWRSPLPDSESAVPGRKVVFPRPHGSGHAPPPPLSLGAISFAPLSNVVAVSQHSATQSQHAIVTVACPAEVVAGQAFDLHVRIAAVDPKRSPLKAASVTVQIVADGFDPAEGGQWRKDVPVHPDGQEGRHQLSLTPRARDVERDATHIHTLLSAQGRTVGVDSRQVTVLAAAAFRTAPPGARATGERPSTLVDLAPESSADLTVRIIKSERTGVLLWTLDSPHAHRVPVPSAAAGSGRALLVGSPIELPDAPAQVDVGTQPDRFAKLLVEAMTEQEGKPLADRALAGLGATIAQHTPVTFWKTLTDIAARVGGPPSVLILSQDPYIPWELASMDPPINPALPPYLGAQARVGRWVLASGSRPPLQPPLAVTVTRMEVVSGDYRSTPGWERIRGAEEEARELQQRYGAVGVAATPLDIDAHLRTGRAQLIHFAVHGEYKPGTAGDGLVMTTGDRLTPFHIRGYKLDPQVPFIYLNACQVGASSQLLGDYAGMAESFLFAGASAVVAPLWSVPDAISKELALRFYRELEQGATPAEALRRARVKSGDTGPMGPSTAYAFLLFGHPLMNVSLPKTRATVSATPA